MIKVLPFLMLSYFYSLFKSEPEWIYMNPYVPQKITINSNNANNSVNTPNGMATYNPNPGDTLYFASNKGAVAISYLSGAEGLPLIITAAPGVVIGGNSGGVNFTFDHLQWVDFVDLTLRANTSNVAKCMYVGNFDHVGIYRVKGKYGADGLQVKTDFSSGDFYPTVVNVDLRIVDCRFDSSGAENYYIGWTGSPTAPSNLHIAPPIIGVYMRRDSSFVSQWDGIQVANCQGLDAEDLYIDGYGLEGTSSQWSGFQQGGATTINHVSNLTVKNGQGPGLSIFGKGTSIYNNVILENCSTVASGDGNIFIDNRQDYGQRQPKLCVIINGLQMIGSGPNRPIYVLNGTDGGKSNQADSGVINNFTYTAANWPQSPGYGVLRVRGGTDGVATTFYRTNVYSNGRTDKIRLQ